MFSFKIILLVAIISAVFAGKLKKQERGHSDWSYCIPEAEGFVSKPPTCVLRCIKATKPKTQEQYSKCLNTCCQCTTGCLSQCQLNKGDANFPFTPYWKQNCVNSCCGLNVGWDTLYPDVDPKEEEEEVKKDDDWARCVPELDGFFKQAPTCYNRCLKVTNAKTFIQKNRCLNDCCICTRGCLVKCAENKKDPNFDNTNYHNQHCINGCCGLNSGWNEKYRY